ncbi:MerR family transcriptional regulator [Mesonia sediminis]|jgi:DNA-binding transcriptional MerR regulator|uniref:MerR family transcriptional regulator n=1 Tax=Mesonia sediminis TaxID=1703946 RepID=A0ABW5SGN5_9FLAO
MEYVKNEFNIKDLEALSGVKAHTIRIWEKRYHILKPERTDTNIRVYDTKALQRLLNIAFLNENGYKISRISKLKNDEIDKLTHEIRTANNAENRAIKAFFVSMYNFDHSLFLNTYNALLEKMTFQEIYEEVFIPMLKQIGDLWQTNTVKPAHEHFISHLIRQKLFSNIEKLQIEPAFNKEKIFILFLPNNEIHDIGLLYLQYSLLSLGYKVVYLGHSIPLEDLTSFASQDKLVYFVSVFTIKPESPETYLKEFYDKILANGDSNRFQLALLGLKTKALNIEDLPPQINIYENPTTFIRSI